MEFTNNENLCMNLNLFDNNGRADVGLTCSFCGDKVYIQVCDDEGNQHDKNYLKDQWSGLSFALVHGDADVECPINGEEMIGEMLYDSIDEAITLWNKRV